MMDQLFNPNPHCNAYYIFLTSCEPDMCHTIMIQLPWALIFLQNSKVCEFIT